MNALLLGAAAAVPPPRWGGNNGTLAWSAFVNMTDISDSPLHPRWQFEYRYDWRLQSDRYDHAKGQHDEVCKWALPSSIGSSCTVLNVGGNVSTTYIMSGDTCCACRAPWMPFTIRSDWLQDGGASYVGVASVDGQPADEWLKQGASDNHYYATRNAAQAPIRYMEHKHGMLKQWDFIEYDASPPDPASLEAPAGCEAACESKLCGGKAQPRTAGVAAPTAE